MMVQIVGWLALGDVVLAIFLATFIASLGRRSGRPVSTGQTVTLGVLLALPGLALYGLARLLDFS